MKLKLFSIIALSGSLSVFGQESNKTIRCSQMDAEAQLQKENPNRLAELEAYEKELNKWIEAHPYDSQKTRATINIPVVVHVLWNKAVENISDAQILSAINVLNEDFNRKNADASKTPSLFTSVAGAADVNWCMAVQDPQGKPTNGIIRIQTTKTGFATDNGAKKSGASFGGSDAWPTDKYFNIWCVNFTDQQLLGYGEFPTNVQTNTHGFCATYKAFGLGGANVAPFNLGRTGTHEVGHCFNLKHIWGDEAQCAADDGVTDTPQQKSENYGVKTFPQGPSAAGGCCTASDQSSMFMNYMDYTDDGAMNIFTKGQVTRMLAVLNTGPYSKYNLSKGCTPVATGLNEFDAASIFNLSPNPTNGLITLTIKSALEKNAIVNVKNILGETMSTISLNALGENVSIDLSHHADGVYFIELINNGKVLTQKLILDKE